MISDVCIICKEKIDEHEDDWADVGPKEKATDTAHFRCLGLQPLKDAMQESLDDAMRRMKNKNKGSDHSSYNYSSSSANSN